LTCIRSVARVRFAAEHRFPGTPEEVCSVLADPDFHRGLELPDLRLLDVHPANQPARDAAPTGDPGAGDPGSDPAGSDSREVGLVLRYEYTGHLDPVALRLLGGTRLTWSQELRLHRGSSGWLVFSAEANPALLHGRADFTLERDGEGTVRRLEGELVVAVPVVGGMAERRIVPGVLQRLDVEADAVRRRIGAPQRGT
jgi:hypothetical protein